MNAIQKALKHSRPGIHFRDAFPWITLPFIIGAPMRIMSGPHLALAISSAGGLGFIGPGAKPQDTSTDLATVRELLSNPSTSASAIFLKFFQSHKKLPVGVGFQLWNGNVNSAVSAVREYHPCAAWLFAPRNGQGDLDEWTVKLREASPGIQIWTQIGTIQEGKDAAQSNHPPDVLVIQGSEAGGHGRATDGMGIMSLFPEVADSLRGSNISLVAAGGIADGRGVAAALGLGARGVVMGTRFLASTEARISKGYQDEVIRATDAAHSTTRTQLYNHLRGTMDWPEQFSPRGIVNRSWHDHQEGVAFEELKKRHDEAAKLGNGGWGLEGRLATYAGASIGLVRSVEDAGVIVERSQKEAKDILRSISDEMREESFL